MGSTCGEYLNYNNMGGETEVETPVPVDNKVEDTVKTDKEIIAEEEKADKPEKETEETESKEEEKKDEPKKAAPAKPKKPILHTKVWEEDKVYLYQSPRTPQSNVEHAMIKMVENHLYWAIMNWRTSNVDNTIKAYKVHLPTFYGSKIPIGILNMHFKFNVCRKTQKK